MKVKNKDKKGIIFPTKAYAILLIGIVFALVWWGFGGAGQFVQTNIPLSQKTDTWAGNDIKIESSYLGSASTGTAMSGLSDGTKVSICGLNDVGKVSIANSYSVSGSTLFLDSSMGSARGNMCDQENYIKVNVYLPEGKITTDCSLNLAPSPKKSGISTAFCSFSGVSAGGISNDGNMLGGLNDFAEVKTQDIEAGNYVILLRTSGVNGGSANSQMSIKFEPAQVSQVIIDPVTNQPIEQLSTDYSPISSESSASSKLSLIDKINRWFDGVFQRIKELFR